MNEIFTIVSGTTSDRLSSAPTIPHFIRGWLRYLLEQLDLLFTEWHKEGVCQLLHLAYSIGHEHDISQVLEPKLLSRVRKFGDFYGAALGQISNAASLPTDQLRDLQFIEAPLTLPQTVSLRANFVEAINMWAQHTGELEVSSHGEAAD